MTTFERPKEFAHYLQYGGLDVHHYNETFIRDLLYALLNNLLEHAHVLIDHDDVHCPIATLGRILQGFNQLHPKEKYKIYPECHRLIITLNTLQDRNALDGQSWHFYDWRDDVLSAVCYVESLR